MRRPKKLDPETQWIVKDSTNQPVTPAFYPEELAKSVMKELSRGINGLELRREEAEDVDGSFVEALHLLSRENRWLDTVRLDKRYFQGLCEGWLTAARASLPEQAQVTSQ